MRHEFSVPRNLPIEDTEWDVWQSLTDLKINAEVGESILIILDKETRLVLDKEIKYVVSTNLGIKSSQVEVFPGLEALLEEAHIEVLKKRICECLRDRKVVVATAVDKKFNKKLLKLFKYTHKLKVQK